MEPSNNYYPNNYTQPRQLNLRKIANWLIVLAVLLGLWLLFSAFFGYGTLKIKLPNNSKVLINGHEAESNSVHVRTGSYQLTVYSPTAKPSTYDVRVWLWGTTFNPHLEKRSSKAIVASTIGAYGLYGVPSVANEKWFNNNTWFVGLVGPGSAAPIALHWNGSTWQLAYFNASKEYPDDSSKLPSNVAKYVQKLEGNNVQ